MTRVLRFNVYSVWRKVAFRIVFGRGGHKFQSLGLLSQGLGLEFRIFYSGDDGLFDPGLKGSGSTRGCRTCSTVDGQNPALPIIRNIP